MTQTVLLRDVSEVLGGGTPSTKNSDFWGGDIPWITPRDLSNHHNVHISRGDRNITEAGLAGSSARLLPDGAIIFSSRAPIGYVTIASVPMTTNQGCKGIICNEEHLHNRYLYYWLKQNKEHIEGLAGGSTFKEISTTGVRELKIVLPDLETQKKIADILGTIDEKIELNRQMNETLEQMGQALFRHYFIDNPEAEKWETVNVSNLIDFIGGSQPPKSEHIYEPREGYVRFVQNRDYSSDGHKTYIPVAKRNKLCTVTDIMMDKYGEAGRVRFGIEGAYNVALAKIIPKHDDMQEYLRSYFSMPQIQRSLEGAAAASTRSSLNATTFAGLKIQLPPNDLLSQYEASQKDVIYGIMENAQQIQTLTTLRDTLLPRLISGKVEV